MEFWELIFQDPAQNIATKPQGSLLSASTPSEGLLHLVVLDRYVGIVNAPPPR